MAALYERAEKIQRQASTLQSLATQLYSEAALLKQLVIAAAEQLDPAEPVPTLNVEEVAA